MGGASKLATCTVHVHVHIIRVDVIVIILCAMYFISLPLYIPPSFALTEGDGLSEEEISSAEAKLG